MDNLTAARWPGRPVDNLEQIHPVLGMSSSAPEARDGPRRYFSRGVYHTVLTVHIALSVALLGDTMGFLAVAIRAAGTENAVARMELIKVLQIFGLGFGITLSFGALFSGIALGLGTRWGVLRYPWVVAKLALLVSVMAVGGLLIGPALNAMLASGADTTARLIAAAAYDVVALALATTLGVFKPGRPFRSPAVG